MRWPVATGRTTPVRGRASRRLPHAPGAAEGGSGWGGGPRGACARRGTARRRPRPGPRRAAGWRRRAGGRVRSRWARRRCRATPTRRRYSLTSGGRALALGDPAERTRWQRVWTSATVAGLVGVVIVSLPVRRPSRAASSRGHRRPPTAGSAARGHRSRTPPRRRTRRDRGPAHGRGRAAAPRCGRRTARSARPRLARARAFNQRSSGGRVSMTRGSASAPPTLDPRVWSTPPDVRMVRLVSA